MTTTSDISDKPAVRLDPASREAVATIITAISTPHRRPATVSEAIRAALIHAAATFPSQGGPLMPSHTAFASW